MVSVGGGSDYEVFGFEPLVVAAAHGDEVIQIGPATVAVPLLDVVEFAAVHGGSAFEASAVSDGHREPLGGVGEALLTS